MERKRRQITRLGIPSLNGGYTDPKEELISFYSLYYLAEKSDSPDGSIFSLYRRAAKIMRKLKTGERILDLGAGRQNFEAYYRRVNGKQKQSCSFVTVDIASIKRVQLLKSSFYNHVRADGGFLPFSDAVFPLAVSNMALDFMPEEARRELLRVLTPSAQVYLNLHHPSLIEEGVKDLRQKAEKKGLTFKERKTLSFWQHLKDNQILFQNQEQIRETFYKDFIIQRIGEGADKEDKWWEVDMLKR